MGLASLFQKKTNYFDKQMKPQCGYCQFGKRTKEGNRILCEKLVSLKEESDSCAKFVYSPLKRVPIKQLKNEGFVADEEMYVEIEEKEPEKKPEAETSKTEAAAPTEDPVSDEPAQEAPAENPKKASDEAAQEKTADDTHTADAKTVSPVPGFENLDEIANAAAQVEAAAEENN